MDKEEKTIRDLYPELSKEELKEAKANLKEYLDVVKRIHDKLPEEEKLKLAIRLQWEKRFLGRKNVSQK